MASSACTTTVIVVPEITVGVELGDEDEPCPIPPELAPPWPPTGPPGPWGPMGAGGRICTQSVAAAAVDNVGGVAPLDCPLVDPLVLPPELPLGGAGGPPG